VLSRVHPKAWIGAFVALYLVLLFPACWIGAQMRAQQQRVAGPSSSNNNEEREEHEQHEAVSHDAQGQPPPQPSGSNEPAATRVRIAYALRLTDSLLPSRAPSVFSVRRLL
jgi:hypothetical protein